MRYVITPKQMKLLKHRAEEKLSHLSTEDRQRLVEIAEEILSEIISKE